MTGLMAKLTALASLGLLLAAAGVLLFGSSPGLRGGTEVKAEFEDAYPLFPGNHVRVAGAVAGEVTDIELGDDGKAHITMRLFEGTDEPRRDAIAAIRQEDVTGDSYLSLSPGHAREPLGDRTISTRRTLASPRFDDLLNAFDEPVREGLKLALVELGRTLEGRGEDVNAAALRLRPGLSAANQALSEVRSQNRALGALIEDAERVTGQAADRSDELGGLVDSLARTVRTTSGRATELDRALEVAPQTARAARGTLTRLTRLTTAGRPLAVRLNRMAPELVRGAHLLGPFVDDASAILADVEPTLGLTNRLLRASKPTLEANPKRVFTAPFDLTAGIGGLLDTLVGDPALIKALFNAECYGGRKCRPVGESGLGAIAVEGGRQTGFPPDYDSERFMVRAVAIPSCELFGEPIGEGCLERALANLDRFVGSLGGLALTSKPRQPAGARAPRPSTGARPGPGATPRAPGAGGLQQTLQGQLDRLLPPGRPRAPGRAPVGRELDRVLDYLLGP